MRWTVGVTLHGIGDFAVITLEAKSMMLLRIVIPLLDNYWGPDGDVAPGTVLPSIAGKSTSILNRIAVDIHNV